MNGVWDGSSHLTKRNTSALPSFSDGTWNTTSDNTNVWRLAALCAPVGNDGVAQVCRYDVGVNGLRGGTFGKGVVRISSRHMNG